MLGLLRAELWRSCAGFFSTGVSATVELSPRQIASVQRSLLPLMPTSLQRAPRWPKEPSHVDGTHPHIWLANETASRVCGTVVVGAGSATQDGSAASCLLQSHLADPCHSLPLWQRVAGMTLKVGFARFWHGRSAQCAWKGGIQRRGSRIFRLTCRVRHFRIEGESTCQRFPVVDCSSGA